MATWFDSPLGEHLRGLPKIQMICGTYKNAGKYHVALSPVVMHVDSSDYEDEYANFYRKDYKVKMTDLPQIAYTWNTKKDELKAVLIGEGHAINVRTTKFVITERENVVLIHTNETGNTGNEATTYAYQYFLGAMIIALK